MAVKKKKIIEKPKKTEEDKVKKIKIRVIGIGGGGGSIVSEIAQVVKRASFFAANTDFKALKDLSRNVERFQFGQNLTHGLGTGMNPDIGEEVAKQEKERIKKILENQDMVILIASLGGGVGSGAAPVFAQVSKKLGNLTYGIFTFPFKFEGERKMEIARNSLRKLRGSLNAISIIPNEKIFQIIDRDAPLKNALSSINKILSDGLQSLIEIIYMPGLINVDFADLKTIFGGRGGLTYLNSIEAEKGETKELIERAINSPLYPYGISGAKGVLINISGQKNLSLVEVSQISKTISEKVHKEAKIIFGISGVKKSQKTKVTLLATGCSKPRNNSETSKIVQKKKKKIEAVKESIIPVKKSKISVKVKEEKKEKKELPKSQKPQTETKKEETKKEGEIIIRKNALAIKKEIEEEEVEMLDKEKFWETPAFLRKKLIKGQ